MEGSCAKCRYAIYFTEKQAFEGAMVVCPKCGAGNIVLFNRGSDNPRFIIKLGENLGQKKRVKASLNNSSDVPSDFRLPGDGQSSGLQLETDMESEYKDTGIKELIEQELVPEYQGGENRDDAQRNMVFERSTQIRVSSYGDKKKISGIKLVFLLSISLVFVCGGYYVWQHRQELQSYTGDYALVEVGVEQGKQIVKAMQSKYPAVAENLLMYIKNGELAFSRDSLEGYQEAQEWFGKAFSASPDNDEIIARFVESHIMWGDKVNDFRLLEELVLLLDYGLQSKPGSASLARAKSRLFIMLKQPRKAFINAERALKFERENIDNQIAYAQALSFSNGPLAAQMLENILLMSAYPVYTRRILGDVYFKQGNLANAERVWTEILIESPHSCITCEPLALLYEDIGLYDKAAGMYVRLIKNKGDMVNGPLGLARSLSLAGKKPEKIAEQLETIIEEKKGKMQEEQLAEGYISLTYLYQLMGKIDESRSSNLNALRANKGHPLARYQYIFQRIAEGYLDNSADHNMEEDLGRLVFEIEDLPEVWTLQGRLQELRNRIPDAIASYMKAIEIDDSYRPAYFLLARIQLQARSYRKAFKTLWKLAKHDPEYWDNHPRRSMLSQIPDSAPMLLKALAKVEKNMVDQDELKFIKGLVSHLKGDYKKARRYFKAVIKNNPRHKAATCWLAFDYLQSGNISAAEKLLQTIEHSDSHSDYLKAQIAQRRLDDERSIKKWQVFVNTYNFHAEGNTHLALAYFKYGNKKEAAKVARRAYSLDPKSVKTCAARYLVGD